MRGVIITTSFPIYIGKKLNSKTITRSTKIEDGAIGAQLVSISRCTKAVRIVLMRSTGRKKPRTRQAKVRRVTFHDSLFCGFD